MWSVLKQVFSRVVSTQRHHVGSRTCLLLRLLPGTASADRDRCGRLALWGRCSARRTYRAVSWSPRPCRKSSRGGNAERSRQSSVRSFCHRGWSRPPHRRCPCRRCSTEKRVEYDLGRYASGGIRLDRLPADLSCLAPWRAWGRVLACNIPGHQHGACGGMVVGGLYRLHSYTLRYPLPS